MRITKYGVSGVHVAERRVFSIVVFLISKHLNKMGFKILLIPEGICSCEYNFELYSLDHWDRWLDTKRECFMLYRHDIVMLSNQEAWFCYVSGVKFRNVEEIIGRFRYPLLLIILSGGTARYIMLSICRMFWFAKSQRLFKNLE